VLSYAPRREADRVYSILTRDFGLIRATALGVRKESSKLRGALEPLVISNISLVRGKEFWRITSAEVVSLVRSLALHKPLALMQQLVQGEAQNAELYDVIESVVMSGGEVDEVDLVAKMLLYLGYLEESDLDLDRPKLIQAINKGIQASSLVSK
jgi:recombinational DNA repair protein (RecF pathway)